MNSEVELSNFKKLFLTLLNRQKKCNCVLILPIQQVTARGGDSMWGMGAVASTEYFFFFFKLYKASIVILKKNTTPMNTLSQRRGISVCINL